MEEKILRFLPDFYAKSDGDGALRHIVDALARQMMEAESHLQTVMLSHYVDFASRNVSTRSLTEDLDRIGALYNIKRSASERLDPANPGDEDEALREHRRLLEMYRARLKATIKIFLEGLATTRAIANTVAAVFRLELLVIVLPGHKEEFKFDDAFLGIETDGSTTAAVLRRLDGDDDPFVLEIIDNPLRARTRRVIKKEPSLPWSVGHNGLRPLDPKITVTTGIDPGIKVGVFGSATFNHANFAVFRPLPFPVLRSLTAEQMIIYNDTVPSGKTLIVEPVQGRLQATIDHEEVTDKLVFVQGGSFGYGQFNRSRFGSVFQNPTLSDVEPGVFGESYFNQAVFSFNDPSQLAPFLAPGDNEWRYAQLKQPFDSSKGLPRLMENLNEQPENLPLEIRFEWQENVRAAFAVRLPRGISFLADEKQRKLFTDTVNLVKAAGVEAIFDFQNIFFERHDDIEDALVSKQKTSTSVAEVQNQSVSFGIGGLFNRTYFGESIFN